MKTVMAKQLGDCDSNPSVIFALLAAPAGEASERKPCTEVDCEGVEKPCSRHLVVELLLGGGASPVQNKSPSPPKPKVPAVLWAGSAWTSGKPGKDSARDLPGSGCRHTLLGCMQGFGAVRHPRPV